MQGIFVVVRDGLNVEGDNRARVVEDAQLPNHTNKLALSPLSTAFNRLVLIVLVDPHLHEDVIRSIIQGILQICVLLVRRQNQPDDGDLVQFLSVNSERLLTGSSRWGILQLLDGDREKRLLILIALRLAVRTAVVHVESASAALATHEGLSTELVRAPHEAAARSPELVEPSIIATTESSSVISPSVHLVAILSLSSKLAPFPLPV
mmetsp:Transcript_29590/g.80819  ORF Transcript_29590/g.80819 Transcript_29590/m.80819 type:complete len:207 (-) Transcript_29590:37-657(-)